MKPWGREALRELCKNLPPIAPRRRVRGPAKRKYGEAKKERLDLHAQLMRERFGDIEEYEAEARQDWNLKK